MPHQASETGAFVRIFVIVPSGPLLPEVICVSQTGAFVRIVAIVPNRPLFPRLIWASETDSFVRIFASVCNGLLFPGLIWASQTDAFVRIFVTVPNSPLFPELIWASGCYVHCASFVLYTCLRYCAHGWKAEDCCKLIAHIRIACKSLMCVSLGHIKTNCKMWPCSSGARGAVAALCRHASKSYVFQKKRPKILANNEQALTSLADAPHVSYGFRD